MSPPLDSFISFLSAPLSYCPCHLIVIVMVAVCVACLDGALHLWKTNSNLVRPDQTIEGAHTKGTETGSLVFSVDGRTLLTRGGDDTVKCTFFDQISVRNCVIF